MGKIVQKEYEFVPNAYYSLHDEGLKAWKAGLPEGAAGV